MVTKTIQMDYLHDVSLKKSNPEIGTFIMPIHDGDCGQYPSNKQNSKPGWNWWMDIW
jgi:hypothetical protein